MEISEGCVCIVDDDPDVRLSLESLVRISGFRCHSFESAEAFLAKMEAFPVKALILDIDLPGINGIELLKWMQQNDCSVPTVCFSGNEFDCDAFLQQSVSPISLCRKGDGTGRLLVWLKQLTAP